MGDLFSTAIHEAAHAVVGEELGIRIAHATAVRSGDSLGSISVAGLRPETPDMGVLLAAGYAALKARNLDTSGDNHRSDFEQLDALCRRIGKTDERGAELWREAHARALEMVSEPFAAYAVECVAEELAARAARGFGMGSIEIGRTIAEARADFNASGDVLALPMCRLTSNIARGPGTQLAVEP